MRTDYLRNNPAARSIFSSSFMLNESSEAIDLSKKSAEILAGIFKKIVFDLAPDKNRNPESFSKKVEVIKGSPKFKNLLAKLKDIASETEVVDPVYAENKQLYLQAMKETGETISRMIEIDSSLEAKTIEILEKILERILVGINLIAKSQLNESLGIGHSGRYNRLKKILTSLIIDSKGKDAKSGYGRDWQRIFSQLDQKLDGLSFDKKNVVSDSDRKELLDLEKKVDNLSQEYHNYIVKSSELIMQKIQKNEDLMKKMGDVNDLLTQALDSYTKAYTQEGIIQSKMRDDMDEKESKMNDRVFPLKMGDKDSDARLKNSDLIKSIQKALIDAYAPIKSILNPSGGANGKFESSTSVAIKSIQSVMGNKNSNGEVDRSFVDSILKLDQVSGDDKQGIKDSLEKLRSSYANLSESFVLNVDSFMRTFENKTYLDPEKIENEIKKYQDELGTFNEESSKPSDSLLAEKLAKSLRVKGYNKNAEAEDFLREDGSLKGSYPADFVTAWTDTVNNDKEFAYFFIADEKGPGSLYPTKKLTSNVNKPLNWAKYSSMIGTEEDDVKDYGNLYTSYYKNFCGVDKETKCKPIDGVFGKNADLAKSHLKEMESPYRSCHDSLKPASDHIQRGFIPPKSLDSICSSVHGICGDDIHLDKLSPSEQRFLYNNIVFLSPLVSYDKKKEKWGCALEMMLEKFGIETQEILEKMTKNPMFKSGSSMVQESMCSLSPVKEDANNSQCMECWDMDGDMGDQHTSRVYQTVKKIPAILKSKKNHLKRMSIIDKDSISGDLGNSIFIIEPKKS
jgi:hypothetical protein